MEIMGKKSVKFFIAFFVLILVVMFIFLSINSSTYSLDSSARYKLTLYGNGSMLNGEGIFASAAGETKWEGQVSTFNYDLAYAASHATTFVGWSEEQECNLVRNGITVTLNKDLTLYACSVADMHKATFNGNGGIIYYTDDDVGSIWEASMYGFDMSNDEVISKRSGYEFLGWSIDKSCSNPINSGGIGVAKDMTFYACWKQDDSSIFYDFVLNPNGGALKTDNPAFIDLNGKTTAWKTSARDFELSDISATRSGYIFEGWDKTLNCSSPKKSGYIDLKENTLYYACWEKNSSGGETGSGGSTVDPSKPIINCSSNSIGYGCNDSNTNGGVSNLQTKLKYLGFYSGEVDGNVGPQTVTAIKNFQKNEGLTVDGNAGPATLERLRLKYNEEIQDNNDDETPKDEEEIPVNPLSYYTLKYDTNGGSFANGESIRTIIVSNEAIVEAPPYNPTREGYIFDEWYTSGGQKFTFYEHLTSDVTLVAKWTKIETVDECTYSCNDGDVYDPLDNKCISIQKFNNEKNLMSIVNYNKVCSNGISKFSDYNCTGNCNKEDCASDYNTNFWYEKNTCHFGGSCSDGDDSSCSITMKKECYKTYEPNKDCQNSNEDSKEDNNVSNPSTGSMFLIIVLIVGIGSLVYSIYYYNKNKKKIS